MSKIERTSAISASDAIKMFLKNSGLCSAHNTRRIFMAWDEASGAAAYTLKRYYREGKLYVTLSSSVIRGQLSFQKQSLIGKINMLLDADELYIREDPNMSGIKELILK